MRSLLVITITLLLSAQAAANSTGLRSSKAFAKLGHVLAVPALGIALATAPLHQAAAQGKAEEELTAVVADDPAYRHGAMLLRTSIPPAEGEEKGKDYAFHVAFIGVDGKGNSLLIGRERQSGVNIGENLEKAFESSLYAWDGLISGGLAIRAIDSFEDGTEGDHIFDVVLLEARGLDLAADYQPLTLDDSFPYGEERAMEILTYRLFYSPVLRDEELLDNNFTLRWLRCNSVPHAKLAVINNGFTTCGITRKKLPNSAPLIYAGKLVALQSLDSPTLLDENGDPLVWYATGIPTRAVEYNQALSEAALAVRPAGKLATTWGAIKAQQ